MAPTADFCTSLLLQFDFSNPECVAILVSKILGMAILVGAIGLKFPQILSIYSTGDVEGLSATSFYSEVPLVTTSVVYNYLQGNPFSSYGESVFILLQNLILVFLLWAFMKNRPSVGHVFGVLAIFIVVAVGSISLPKSVQFILPLTNLPLLLISRIPQIIQNFQNRSTGSLSLITNLLTFVGSLVRVFTTIQEVGWDLSLLTGFLLGALTSGVLVLQIVLYGGSSKKDNEAKKKSQ